MSGLDLATGIMATAQFTYSVIQYCNTYISAVKRAPEEIQQLIGELENLRLVLNALESSERQHPNSLDPHIVHTMRSKTGPLETCNSELGVLEERLKDALKNKSVLLWPFRSGEVMKSILVLERVKSTLSLALSVDQRHAVNNVSKVVGLLATSQADISARLAKIEAHQSANGSPHEVQDRPPVHTEAPRPSATEFVITSSTRSAGIFARSVIPLPQKSSSKPLQFFRVVASFIPEDKHPSQQNLLEPTSQDEYSKWQPSPLLANVAGEGLSDVVGFSRAGVWVAFNRGDNSFWPRCLLLRDFGSDQHWSDEKHLRLLADVCGSGNADVVGFGNAGVLVAPNRGNGSFGPTQLVCKGFGTRQKWSTVRHPRFLANVFPNSRLPDIVGFGNRGVYVAQNNGDGTFRDAVGTLTDMCYEAGGWRTDKHPRFVADLTGDGLVDLVGFGNAGVYVSLNRGNGTFGPMKKVVDDFGFDQGWRVDKHPRLLVDITGDGRADVVGFGNAGVLVALNKGDGTFSAPRLAAREFGYAAGWRVEKHTRVLLDATGDGLADIVGFGDQKVYIWENRGGHFGLGRELLVDYRRIPPP